MNKNKLCLSIALAVGLGCATAAHANTMLGSFIEYDGWSLADIDKFNTDTAKPMAVTTLFTNFDMHWGSLNTQLSNIVSRDATPIVSLMPYSSNRHPDMLAAIASGAEDAYLNGWIQSFKLWRDSYPVGEQPAILLRFGHEFNGNWYPWGNQPEAFKAAWRHIHGLFDAAGVNDSVEWVWCANATDVDDYNDMNVYYPGDDVVDWTSLDGYNWGSNYAWTSWKSFDAVFSAAYVDLVSNYPEKPILLGEVASAEASDLPDAAWGQKGNDADAGQSKEAWVSDMLQRIKTDYPAIRAISWFNLNKELSWALNGTAKSGLPNTGLQAYNEQVVDAHYVSDFSALSAEPAPVDDPPKGKGGKADNAKKSGKKGAEGPSNTMVRSSLTTQLSRGRVRAEEQRALALSRMPAVVGEKLRQREADGFRNMSAEALQKMRQQRLELSQ